MKDCNISVNIILLLPIDICWLLEFDTLKTIFAGLEKSTRRHLIRVPPAAGRVKILNIAKVNLISNSPYYLTHLVM